MQKSRETDMHTRMQHTQDRDQRRGAESRKRPETVTETEKETDTKVQHEIETAVETINWGEGGRHTHMQAGASEHPDPHTIKQTHVHINQKTITH